MSHLPSDLVQSYYGKFQSCVERAKIVRAWLFSIAICFMVLCINPPNLRSIVEILRVVTSFLRPGPSLSRKISMFRGTRKNGRAWPFCSASHHQISDQYLKSLKSKSGNVVRDGHIRPTHRPHEAMTIPRGGGGGGGGGGGILTIFWVTGRLGPFDPPFSTYVEFWPLLLGSGVEYWPPFFQAL